MDLDEAISSAETDLTIARARLQKYASDNAPLGARMTAELNYGQAYQRLVRFGIEPKIKLKYRLV